MAKRALTIFLRQLPSGSSGSTPSIGPQSVQLRLVNTLNSLSVSSPMRLAVSNQAAIRIRNPSDYCLSISVYSCNVMGVISDGPIRTQCKDRTCRLAVSLSSEGFYAGAGCLGGVGCGRLFPL